MPGEMAPPGSPALKTGRAGAREWGALGTGGGQGVRSPLSLRKDLALLTPEHWPRDTIPDSYPAEP